MQFPSFLFSCRLEKITHPRILQTLVVVCSCNENIIAEENAHLIYKFVAFDTQTLWHVAEGAKNWGAPWASSAFLYEDIGGLIKRLFHGSNSIAKQIFRNFLCASKLRNYSRHFIPLSETNVRKFYEKIDSPISFSAPSSNILNRVRTSTIGSQKQKVMVPEIVRLLKDRK